MHSPRSFRCNVCTTYRSSSIGFLLFLTYDVHLSFVFISISTLQRTILYSSNVRILEDLPVYRWLLQIFNKFRRDTAFIFILRRTTPQCIRCRVISQCILASSVNLFILINYSAYVLRYYWTIVAILLFIYGCLGANILWVPTFSCIRLHLNFAGIHLTALRPSFCCSQNIFLLVYLNIFLIFLLIDVVISQIRLLITKSVALSK